MLWNFTVMGLQKICLKATNYKTRIGLTTLGNAS